MYKIIENAELLGNESEVLENLRKEREDLFLKQHKLELFISSDKLNKLPQLEKELLIHQKYILQIYSDLLLQRSVEIDNRIQSFYAQLVKK